MNGEVRRTPLASRPTLGMLVMSLDDRYTEALVQSVGSFATANDLNLVVDLLDGPSLTTTDVAHASPYARIRPERYDGLILTGGLAYRGARAIEHLVAFQSRCGNVPLIGTSLWLEGLPSVVPDSYVGMREAVEHLVERHHCRRIAYIGGPLNSSEAEERQRAVEDALAAHGLALDPRLFVAGDFSPAVGTQCAQELLKRGVSMDALVCANDDTAISAMEVLRAHGLRIPADVAVVGFDDVNMAARLPVPLTTVRQSVHEIGRRAAEGLWCMIKGEPLAVDLIVPTTLIVRRSCGCLPEHVMEVPMIASGLEASATEDYGSPAEMHRRRIVLALAQLVEAPAYSRVSGAGEIALPDLIDALWEDIRDPESRRFVYSFADLLGNAQQAGQETDIWHRGLSALREMTVPLLNDRPSLDRAEALFQQARILLGEFQLQAQAQAQGVRDRRQTALRSFTAAAAGAASPEALLPAMAASFGDLDIARCYLSLFETPSRARTDATPAAVQQDGDGKQTGGAPQNEAVRGRLRLVVAYTGEPDGGTDGAQEDAGSPLEAVAPGRAFWIANLVPEGVWQALGERFTAFALPLYVGNEALGLVVLTGSEADPSIYQQLREALSGAVYRAELTRSQQDARREAEAATRRAELALRDALVTQRRYVERSWERYAGWDLSGPETRDSGETARGYARVHDEEGPSDRAWLDVMGKAAEAVRAVIETAGDSGDAHAVHSLAVPLVLYGQEVIGVLGFGRTAVSVNGHPWTAAQIRMAENVARQVALVLETQRLISDVRRRAARLAAAAEVSSTTTAITTLDRLVADAVEMIRERFGLYYAGLFLVDDMRRWAVLVAGTGEAGRAMLSQGHKLEVGGQSMVGTCVATGQARITFDAELEPVRLRNPLLPATRSELALPLISHGQVIGAMTIQDEHPGAFTEEDITILRTMADQLANAVENARLLERMEENLRVLRVATGAETKASWQEFTQGRGRVSYRYQLVDVVPDVPPRPEAVEAMVRGEPVVIDLAEQLAAKAASRASSLGGAGEQADDGPLIPAPATGSVSPGGAEPEGGQLIAPAASSDGTTAPGAPRAGLGVPIRLRDQVLGALNLRFENGTVPPETVQMVEQIADRLAVSLESARLLEQTRRTAQRERLIGEVSRGMRQSLEVDEVLRGSVAQIREALDLFAVSVRLAPEAPENDGRQAGTSTSCPPQIREETRDE